MAHGSSRLALLLRIRASADPHRAPLLRRRTYWSGTARNGLRAGLHYDTPHQAGAFFVTRAKSKSQFRRLLSRPRWPEIP